MAKRQNLTEAVKRNAQGTKVTPIKLVADFILISEELRKEFPGQIQWEKRRDCNNIKQTHSMVWTNRKNDKKPLR